MNFNSLHFLIYLPVVLIVYWLLPQKARWVWLLAASYYFYMSWNAWLVFLIAGTTGVSYAAALLIERTQSKRVKKFWLAATLVVCLGVLVFFKYFNFLLQSAIDFLNLFSMGIDSFALDILLPVGISFYTFQTLSYVIDVYRGDFRAEKHFGYYALFVSYFPQLVAGPIEKPGDLIPQLRAEHKLNGEDMAAGMRILLGGFFRKCVVADFCGIYVNNVFSRIGEADSLSILMAGGLFCIQMYCDFAGYTDIARGTAQLLGFDLLANFRRPYLADSVQDFWRRWHQSLSSWLRDYLYIPLGGSRKGRLRRAVNILFTFLVSGVWHGTGFHFLAWGGLHGLAQIFDIKNWKLPRPVKQLLVFLFVDLTWMVFRVNSLGDLKGMLLILLTDFRLRDFAGMELTVFEWLLVLLGILLVMLKDVANERGFGFRRWILEQNAAARCLIYAGMIGAVVVLGVYGAAYDTSQFLYTQF